MSTADPVALSDESILDYTQRIRQRVIKKLTKDGEDLPVDPKEVLTLNTVLDSMDRTALGSIRAKRDADIGDLGKAATAMVQEVLRRAGNTDLFAAPTAQPRQVAEIPDDMANPTVVPGELEVGLQTMTSDEFLAEFEAKKKASATNEPDD